MAEKVTYGQFRALTGKQPYPEGLAPRLLHCAAPRLRGIGK